MKIPFFWCDMNNFGDALNPIIFKRLIGVDIKPVSFENAEFIGIRKGRYFNITYSSSSEYNISFPSGICWASRRSSGGNSMSLASRFIERRGRFPIVSLLSNRK